MIIYNIHTREIDSPDLFIASCEDLDTLKLILKDLLMNHFKWHEANWEIKSISIGHPDIDTLAMEVQDLIYKVYDFRNEICLLGAQKYFETYAQYQIDAIDTNWREPLIVAEESTLKYDVQCDGKQYLSKETAYIMHRYQRNVWTQHFQVKNISYNLYKIESIKIKGECEK